MRYGLGLMVLTVGLLMGAGDVHAQNNTKPKYTTMLGGVRENNSRDGFNQGGLGQGGLRVGPKTVNPTYGPNGPGPYSGAENTRQPREIWAANSQPVVAENPNGRRSNGDKFIDARTGQVLTDAQVNEALNREKNYDQKNSVQLYDWKLPGGEAGINAGPFKDGRWTLAGNRDLKDGEQGGQLNLDVLRAEAGGTASVGLISNGVQGNIDYKAQATLVGINGKYQTGKYGIAGPVNGETNVSGQAYIGADARLNATGELSTERLRLNGKVGAFAGGKAEGQIEQSIGLDTVGDVKGTLVGEVSYGIGASAEGYFNVDWTNMSVKFGGRASATLGVGAGVGFQTEISVKPLVENYIIPAASAVVDAGAWVANKLCFWCEDPPAPTQPQAVAAGTNVPRPADTVAEQPPPVEGDAGSGKANAAGIRGALGRD